MTKGLVLHNGSLVYILHEDTTYFTGERLMKVPIFNISLPMEISSRP